MTDRTGLVPVVIAVEVVMRQAEGKQTLAAEMLGINRNTLRKKLCEYGLL